MTRRYWRRFWTWVAVLTAVGAVAGWYAAPLADHLPQPLQFAALLLASFGYGGVALWAAHRLATGKDPD